MIESQLLESLVQYAIGVDPDLAQSDFKSGDAIIQDPATEEVVDILPLAVEMFPVEVEAQRLDIEIFVQDFLSQSKRKRPDLPSSSSPLARPIPSTQSSLVGKLKAGASSP